MRCTQIKGVFDTQHVPPSTVGALAEQIMVCAHREKKMTSSLSVDPIVNY